MTDSVRVEITYEQAYRLSKLTHCAGTGNHNTVTFTPGGEAWATDSYCLGRIRFGDSPLRYSLTKRVTVGAPELFMAMAATLYRNATRLLTFNPLDSKLTVETTDVKTELYYREPASTDHAKLLPPLEDYNNDSIMPWLPHDVLSKVTNLADNGNNTRQSIRLRWTDDARAPVGVWRRDRTMVEEFLGLVMPSGGWADTNEEDF